MYDATERLLTLPSFRDLMAKKSAEAAAEAAAETAAKTSADTLIEYFMEKGDTPSSEALARIRSCSDLAVIKGWTRRARRGETSAQIFDGASGSQASATR